MLYLMSYNEDFEKPFRCFNDNLEFSYLTITELMSREVFGMSPFLKDNSVILAPLCRPEWFIDDIKVLKGYADAHKKEGMKLALSGHDYYGYNSIVIDNDCIYYKDLTDEFKTSVQLKYMLIGGNSYADCYTRVSFYGSQSLYLELTSNNVIDEILSKIFSATEVWVKPVFLRNVNLLGIIKHQGVWYIGYKHNFRMYYVKLFDLIEKLSI